MWEAPFTAKFIIDRKEFAQGGFRTAYNAKQIGTVLPEGRKFVIKKYLDLSKQEIILHQESLKIATRKQVQMHMLARNFAKLLKMDAPNDYGEHLHYNKAYYAETSDGESLFLEPYIEGVFTKHVNNDGTICKAVDVELGDKAQTFVHYTFAKCKDMAMALDIQGCGYTMTDPEFATMKERNDEDLYLFCGGNLKVNAITKFLDQHNCSEFCKKLGL